MRSGVARAGVKPCHVVAAVIASTIVASASLGIAAAAESLRSVADILDMPIAEHADRRAAVVRGVVTLVEPLVIQDGDRGIYVDSQSLGNAADPASATPARRLPEPGTQVEVRGVVAPSGYAPVIVADSLVDLGPRPLPVAAPIDYSRLFAGGHVGQRVRATGVVQAILDNPEGWSLIVESASRRFRVTIGRRVLPVRPDEWIDAAVDVTGVGFSARNNRGEFLAPGLYVARPEDIRVVAAASAAPFDLPITPLDAIARFRSMPLAGHRFRTTGVVLFATPGLVYVQEGVGGVRVELTPGARPAVEFRAGDRIDVAGFLNVSGGIGGISWAVARRIAEGPEPAPLAIQPGEILRVNQTSIRTGEVARPGSFDGCLVRCRGRVEAVNVSAVGTTLTLVENDTAFTATLLDPGAAATRTTIPGSEVEIVGIVRTLRQGPSDDDVIRGAIPLSDVGLLVRSANDIRVLRLPPWWTPQRLAIALGGSAAVLGMALAWVILLRREVATQTERLAGEMRGRRDAAIEFDATLRERSRLAANLHDTLLQALAGSVLQIDLCRRSLAGRRIEEAGGQLDVAKRMVKHAAADLRNSVWALRTAPLAGRSFPDSLRALVGYLGAERSGLIDLRFEGGSFPLARFVAGNLLLVTQEAVRNALSHAAATAIEVVVRFDAAAGGVELAVADDGEGFAWGSQRGVEQGHFGLQVMRERIEAVGGRFTIETAPGRGTRVTAWVAMQAHDAAMSSTDACDPDDDGAEPPAPEREDAAAARKPAGAVG